MTEFKAEPNTPQGTGSEAWLPPEAPLEMPRQALEAAGAHRSLLAPLWQMMQMVLPRAPRSRV